VSKDKEYSDETLFSNEKSHHNNGDGTGIQTTRIHRENGDTTYHQDETKYSGLAQGHVTTTRINEFTVDKDGNPKK